MRANMFGRSTNLNTASNRQMTLGGTPSSYSEFLEVVGTFSRDHTSRAFHDLTPGGTQGGVMRENRPHGRHHIRDRDRVGLKGRLLAWASHSADLDWMMTFLGRRGLGRVRSLAVTVGGVAMAMAATVALVSPAGELRSFGKPVLIFGVFVVALIVVRILFPPVPRNTERVVLVFVADIVTGSACLAHVNPTTGLASLSLLTIIGLFCVFYANGWTHIMHAVIGFTFVAISVTMCILDGFDAREVLPAAFGLIAVTSFFLPFIDVYIFLMRMSTMDSHVDPLTLLANRRGLVDHVQNLPRRSTPRTAIAIDVDDFKPINDQHGHAVGDDVLVRIARTLESAMASTASRSLVARTGGDEFVVITDLDSLSARLLADDLRAAIESHTRPRVTASIGVASGVISPSRGIADLIRNADAAMYVAKRHGGNHVADAPRRTARPTMLRRHQPSSP